MDRKSIARETLDIMRQGYYEYEGRRVEIREQLAASVKGSRLFTPEDGAACLKAFETGAQNPRRACEVRTENCSTVKAIHRLAQEGKDSVGVLNFASAKNPGGGFLNGAMAQEESLAASGTLYQTLVAHEEYYRANRAQRSMMYTDHAIYSPDVVFFRDENFALTEKPSLASVLTLPAVNMGQVLQKGEDKKEAERVMRRRMKLALAIFASQGARHLVLGAYGCGVFRNDPVTIAAWWQELLSEEMEGYFDSVFHAVLDRSRDQRCIKAFI